MTTPEIPAAVHSRLTNPLRIRSVVLHRDLHWDHWTVRYDSGRMQRVTSSADRGGPIEIMPVVVPVIEYFTVAR